MAFLYSVYIVMYAVLNVVLGRYVDRVYNRSGGSRGGDVHPAVVNIGGVQFTVFAAVIFASTFIPRGSFSLNPKLLSDQELDHDLDETDAYKRGDSVDSDEINKEKKGLGLETVTAL